MSQFNNCSPSAETQNRVSTLKTGIPGKLSITLRVPSNDSLVSSFATHNTIANKKVTFADVVKMPADPRDLLNLKMTSVTSLNSHDFLQEAHERAQLSAKAERFRKGQHRPQEDQKAGALCG